MLTLSDFWFLRTTITYQMQSVSQNLRQVMYSDDRIYLERIVTRNEHWSENSYLFCSLPPDFSTSERYAETKSEFSSPCFILSRRCLIFVVTNAFALLATNW